jgi:transcriptional regulator with XRE-family HTH domain
MDQTFGSLLRRFREAASLTHEGLAERASLSATAVAALERGRNRTPRLSTLNQVGRALELSPGHVAQLAAPESLAADVEAPGIVMEVAAILTAAGR